jgi:Ca-activated chloride channel family protein
MHSDLHFAQPGWFWLLILMPLPWLLERARPKIAWPSFEGFPPRGRIGWVWLRALPALFRGLAIGGLAFALARPQTVGGTTRIAGQGVAIVVAIDNSSSMNAVDFPTDHGTRRIARLEAAKETFSRFVEGRSDDLIGLVVFANYQDLVCPPVLDHSWLLDHVRVVRSAKPGEDGTNIGDAIALGLDALRYTTPKKKVLVLLTDGNNEPGVPDPLDPEKAAIIARDFGVTVHTIAIGRLDGIPRTVAPDTPVPAMADGSGPNFALLDRLAELTGGRSFSATNVDALDKVFERIDALEKSPVRGTTVTRYEEHYWRCAGFALAMLVLDRMLAMGRLRRLP